METIQSPPQVLIFPLPMQGPVNSMLKLAQLISISSRGAIHVTFLTTEHVHRHLVLHAGARWPGVKFRTFHDGLPEDHPRGGDKFMEMLEAVEHVSLPILRDLIIKGNGGGVDGEQPPVTCVVADGLYGFALDVGNEGGVRVLYFETMSPCCFWVYLCLSELVQHGNLPFQESEDLEALAGVPGMENILRRRDLPDFCRANNPSAQIMIQRAIEQANRFKEAHGVILNTFDELEPPNILSNISNCLHKVYPIGPLHLHLKQRMQIPTMSSSNNLWPEDRNCMEWLDQQSHKSVIYCSFGSQVVLTKEQLMEFWHGLVNSDVRFLWVKRPGSVIGMDNDDNIPEELLKGLREKGFIANWAPQEEVLRHGSIGGFLTHSGWNSTMESIVDGVSMVCWPHYVDQLVNSRCVSEVWRIGFDIKDTCDRVVVENMVREIMQRRRNEVEENGKQLAIRAKKAVDKEGGSSHCSLVRLIDDKKIISGSNRKSVVINACKCSRKTLILFHACSNDKIY